MALRDQPYLPLYVQDFLTDEKLMECSAAATGIYIRIMCILHKSEPYGKFLLRQKDRQSDRQIINFADKFAKHLPYTRDVIIDGLTELIDEGCLHIDGDFLMQKRMVKDNDISLKRSKSGIKGAKVTNDKNKENAEHFAAAKQPANSEYENDNVFDLSNDYNQVLDSIDYNNTFRPKNEKNYDALFKEMLKIYKTSFPAYFDDYEADYAACVSIIQKTEKIKSWSSGDATNGHMDEFLTFWSEIVQYVAGDKWLSSRSLKDLSSREWQRLGQHMNKMPTEIKKKTKDDKKSEYEKNLEAQREAARNKPVQE